MPQASVKDHENQSENSQSSVLKWWRRIHFSGRVIMCSVLFGFGLILIGGLLFAIHTDDDTKSSVSKDSPRDVVTRAPNNYVGPAVMGVGGFVLVLGVIMCLFETQICRKRTGDSSPLISDTPDKEGNNSEPTDVTSSSHSQKNHRQDKRKNGTSSKRSKGRNHKHHSKERNQKSPSPKSPPISIEKPKHILTSSEDNFLTPPNTLNAQSVVLQNQSRDAENQTSSSLLKSFTSSDPSWSQSAEFQTPSTSFGEQSMSLENSTEVGEKSPQRLLPTEMIQKSPINIGFLTPMTFADEKMKDMSSKIQNQKNDLQKPMSHNKDELYNTLAVTETFNIKSDEHDAEMVNVNNTTETEKYVNISSKNDDNINNVNAVADEVASISKSKLEDGTLPPISNNTNENSEHIISIANVPIENVHDKESTANAEEASKDVQDDFESSTSSNVTIISPNISHKGEINENVTETKVGGLTPQVKNEPAAFECSSNNEDMPEKEDNQVIKSDKLTENGAGVNGDKLCEKDDIDENVIEKSSQKYS